MSNITYVKGDELTALANSLKSKGESINNEYKNNCSQALSMSTECLQASGLNTAEFFQSLDSIYANLNQRITEVSDFLTNVVVAEYQALNDALVSNFNNKFANEMSGVLGLTGKTVGGMIKPIVRPGIVRPVPISPGKPGIIEPKPITPIRPPDAIVDPIKPGDPRYSEPVYKLSDDEYNPRIYHTTGDVSSSYGESIPLTKDLDTLSKGEVMTTSVDTPTLYASSVQKDYDY